MFLSYFSSNRAVGVVEYFIPTVGNNPHPQGVVINMPSAGVCVVQRFLISKNPVCICRLGGNRPSDGLLYMHICLT